MRPSRSDFMDEFREHLPRGPHRQARRPGRGERPDRQILLDLAARPVSVNSRPPYPCTAEELRSCIDRPPPNMGQPLCPREAVHHLGRFLKRRREQSDEWLAARERFERAIMKYNKTNKFDPRLAIKAFKDVDTIFFAGKLMGKTMVSWAGPEEFEQQHKCPVETCLGATEYTGQGTAWIMLSSYTILHKPEPFLAMWETLLHEMVHAFFYVKCSNNPDNPGDVMKGPAWCGGHGTDFRRIISLVDERAKAYFGLSAIGLHEDYDEDETSHRGRGRHGYSYGDGHPYDYGYGCGCNYGASPRGDPRGYGPAY